jgi:biopolymer transport protein ExbB
METIQFTRLVAAALILFAGLSLTAQTQTDSATAANPAATVQTVPAAPVSASPVSALGDVSTMPNNMVVAMNKEKIESSMTSRHSFLVVGGLPGFMVWMAIFVNTVLTLFFSLLVFIHVRRNRVYPKELIHRIKHVLADGELGFAMEACVPGKNPLSRILFEAFKNINDGFDACYDAMQIAVKAETEKLFKPVRALVTCGIFSICLGLFGASLGVMEVFRNFANNPEIGNFQQAAFELSQTTYFLAVGIFGAGIAFLLHHYADGKVSRIIVNTEKIAYDLIKVLRGVHVAGELPDMSTMTQLINYNSLKNIPALKKNK